MNIFFFTLKNVLHIIIILIDSYPLYGTPFAGNIPLEYTSPIREFENFVRQIPSAQPMAGIQKKVEPLQPRWVILLLIFL